MEALRTPERPTPALVWAVPLLAVLVAWLFPAAAVITVWPVLFLLPGWLLVRRLVPYLTVPGQVGAGIVLSVMASAHLVNALGRLLGSVSTATVLLAALALWVLTVVLAVTELRQRAAPWRWSALLSRHRAAWVICAVVVIVVGSVMQRGVWHLGPDGWIAGGWNWSDLMVHVSIATSTLHGNFPPQVPYFAGVLLTYHWFGDFHAGLAAGVAGFDVIPVMVLSSVILSAALALVVWELAWRLTHHGRVAWLSALLAVFGGGMGYIRLPIDVSQHRGGWLELASQHSYDNAWLNAWPFFRIASVFGTGILDQRATTYGLPMLVTAVLLLHVAWRRPQFGGVILAGCVAALLAPFDFFLFPCVYAVLGVQLLARRAWRDRDRWLRGLCLFAPVVLGLPFILSSVLQQHTSGRIRLVLGWPEAPLSDGAEAVLFFYATNLGVPFLLALVALCWPRTPHRWLLAGWMVGLFAVPNVVVASSMSFDMNKIFQAMWIAVAIAAAWTLRSWPRPLLAVAVAASVLSPALAGLWTVRSDTVALTNEQVAVANWIASHTPQGSVFVTDAFINSPVDLAGRLRLSTYGPYVSVLGYDPAQREADIHTIYCGGPETAAETMRRYGATFVLSSGGVLDCTGAPPTAFTASPLFDTSYSSGTISVWRLR